jgi:hypothetical protein
MKKSILVAAALLFGSALACQVLSGCSPSSGPQGKSDAEVRSFKGDPSAMPADVAKQMQAAKTAHPKKP